MMLMRKTGGGLVKRKQTSTEAKFEMYRSKNIHNKLLLCVYYYDLLDIAAFSPYVQGSNQSKNKLGLLPAPVLVSQYKSLVGKRC